MAVPPLAPPRIPPETRLVVIPAKNENPTKPQVEVTVKADSAAFNQQMIANAPGRQPSDAYALFKNDSNGEYRECIVSGFERRKVIKPNGEVIYTGSLPSLRTVSAELADIPSWHPHEAGCIISVEHKKNNSSK